MMPTWVALLSELRDWANIHWLVAGFIFGALVPLLLVGAVGGLAASPESRIREIIRQELSKK